MPDISLLPKEYALKAFKVSETASTFAIVAYIFIVLTFVIWGGLYFYKDSLQGEIKGLETQIQASPLKDKTGEIKEIKSAEILLDNFNKILMNHIYFSNVFKLFEAYTLKKVSLNHLNIDIKKRAAIFSGVADSYESFAKQLNKFKSNPDLVKKTDIESLGFSRTGIDFTIKILINQNIWLK